MVSDPICHACGRWWPCSAADWDPSHHAEQYTVEVHRIDAAMRMLVDSGDMTPIAVRQITAVLGADREGGDTDVNG